MSLRGSVFFLDFQSSTTLEKETLIGHIMLTALRYLFEGEKSVVIVKLFLFSLTMFIISTTMGNIISDGIPWSYSMNVSPARHNFLIIATTLIPFCWILSSFLHWYHNHKMDIGAATCGAKFVFGQKT